MFLFKKKIPDLVCQGPGLKVAHYRPLDIKLSSRIQPYVRKRYLSYHHKVINVEVLKNQRLAVVVPYRRREAHLAQFVPHMNLFLTEQSIDFKIFVVHQADEKPFNRGCLCNIGYHLNASYDYFCFHDIDMLPERVAYACTNHPTVLMQEGFPTGYFSGALLFRREDFLRINGYGNEFWGWGWEDIDLRDRCYLSGLTPLIEDDTRYEFLPHPPSTTQTTDGVYHQDKKILKMLKQARRRNRELYLDFANGQRDFMKDGLSNLTYQVVDRVQLDGYERIDVRL